ncbi:MAG: hypothetical protein ACR2OW_05045 [Methyloligellaceae bacterium]
MSVYAVQKLIRDVNRRPDCRESWFESRNDFMKGYDLTGEEAQALEILDIGSLYKMGVHGLLLRPFTIIHQVPEPDYLNAIRS